MLAISHGHGTPFGNVILLAFTAAGFICFVMILINYLSGKTFARKIDRQRKKWK